MAEIDILKKWGKDKPSERVHTIGTIVDNTIDYHTAIWSDSCHPDLSDEQWEQVCLGETVEPWEGRFFWAEDLQED